MSSRLEWVGHASAECHTRQQPTILSQLAARSMSSGRIALAESRLPTRLWSLAASFWELQTPWVVLGSAVVPVSWPLGRCLPVRIVLMIRSAMLLLVTWSGDGALSATHLSVLSLTPFRLPHLHRHLLN